MTDPVQLPAREPELVARVRSMAPIWPVYPSATRVSPPASGTAADLNGGDALEKGKACYSSVRDGSDCCQTLKDPKERHLINPDLVRLVPLSYSVSVHHYRGLG